ncbi:type IV secretory system conjugative DNA transfer family protein [Rhodopirellula sp. MGV]|uniref:type IV secretory system conjugative DNA transfer family protein n=1 Tax=Rhodopirellula sp. MGV TaxID=2023130 RepID=UPI001304106B|nr:type IV secretory system conjugative DNA transfer family protein [Rhodopirellula sp. MGV]
MAVAVGGLVATAGLLGAKAYGLRYGLLALAMGLVISKLPDFWVAFVESSPVHTLLRSGREPQAEFAQAYHLKKYYAEPFRNCYRPGHGYCSTKLFVGTSMRQSSLRRLDVWNDDAASEFICGTIGSAKFVSDLAIRLITYMGSGVYISVKPELADFAVGRNVDTSPQFADELRTKGIDPGIDSRGISTVQVEKPRFRSMVPDPFHQSTYWDQDCPWNPLDELPDDNPDIAEPRCEALCWSIIEERLNASEPFFQEAPRAFLYSGIGHAKTRWPKERQNLPEVADFLIGRDPVHGGASPDQFKKNLCAMMANKEWGGTIATGANMIAELGDRAYGSVKAEVALKLKFCMNETLRAHLSRPSRFSYEEVGDSAYPLSIFLIPGRVAPQASAAWMRMHVAMSTAVFKTRPVAPELPIFFAADEFKQYAVPDLAEQALVLRSSNVKLALYFHDIQSAISALGEHGYSEFITASTSRFYGVRNPDTAKRISEMLGHHNVGGAVHPLADPQTIMRELAVRSNMTYVLPYGGPPVLRLRRRGFKTIRTKDGLYLRGLPLAGHYDEGLTRHTRRS